MLPRYARLRKAREFRAVFAARGGGSSPSSAASEKSSSRPQGWVVSTSSLVLHAARRRRSAASTAPLRFGFSISKKVSKRSHDRNRLKRRLSEIARKEILPIYQGASRYDCVVVVRQGAVNADSLLLRRDLFSLLRRTGIQAISTSS